MSRVATYTFMISGAMAPLVAIVGAKLWPKHPGRVALASLGLFVIALIALTMGMLLC